MKKNFTIILKYLVLFSLLILNTSCKLNESTVIGRFFKVILVIGFLIFGAIFMAYTPVLLPIAFVVTILLAMIHYCVTGKTEAKRLEDINNVKQIYPFEKNKQILANINKTEKYKITYAHKSENFYS